MGHAKILATKKTEVGPPNIDKPFIKSYKVGIYYTHKISVTCIRNKVSKLL